MRWPWWFQEARLWVDWAKLHVRWLLAGYIGLLLLIGIVRWWWTRPRRQDRTVHGSERWASWRQLWQAGAFNRLGMPLGVAHGWYVRAPREQNVVLFAPPGEGKTNLIAASLLARDQASAIVLDVSGELLALTGNYRRTRGPVYVWEPTSFMSDQLNPYDLIDWGTVNEVEQLHRLTSHVVSSKGLQTSSGAAHYERVADDVLATGSLYVAHEHTPPSCTFAEMLEWFSSSERRIPAILQDLAQHPHPSIRRGAGRLLLKGAQKLQDDWTAATEWLTRWEDPKLARNTARTTIPWRDLQTGSQPMTLYFRLSSDDLKGRLNRVFRMIEDLLTYHLTNRPPAAYRWELDHYFDDVATMGDFPALDEMAVEKRKYGFRLMCAFQSPAQAWHESGRYAGLLNSCGCWVIYRQNDPDSAEYLAKKLGETTVLQPMDRSTWNGRFGRLRGVQAVKRPLLTPGELQSIPPDQVVFCVKHLKVRGQRINPFRDPHFAGALSGVRSCALRWGFWDFWHD